MTTGHRIFEKNARRTLRDIGMQHLDPAHGAAVEVVRWCLAVRGRPTHHRQLFLERECLELLAYLETVAGSDNSAAWRTLEERIRFHAETIRDRGLQPCARPWLAAIWHTLPELAGLGQHILDRQAEKNRPAPVAAPVCSDTVTETGGDGDKGSGGKAGSATSNRPRPLPRLAFPIVPVTPTPAEEKALDLRDEPENTNTNDGVAPDSPETENGMAGPRPPGAKP